MLTKFQVDIFNIDSEYCYFTCHIHTVTFTCFLSNASKCMNVWKLVYQWVYEWRNLGMEKLLLIEFGQKLGVKNLTATLFPTDPTFEKFSIENAI